MTTEPTPSPTPEELRQLKATIAQVSNREEMREAVRRITEAAPDVARRAFDATRNAHAMIANYSEWVAEAKAAMPPGEWEMVDMEQFLDHPAVSRQTALMMDLGNYTPDLIDVAVSLAGGIGQSLARFSAYLAAHPEEDPGANSGDGLGTFLYATVAALVPMAAWCVENLVGMDATTLRGVTEKFGQSSGMADLLDLFGEEGEADGEVETAPEA